MNWSQLVEWVKDISAIFGLFVMLIAVVGGLHSFWLWVTKPKVHLRFDEKWTFHEVHMPVNGITTMTKWVHLVAENPGRVLTNCRAYLTDVWRLNPDDSLTKDTDFRAKLPLTWAHSGGRFTNDLLKKETAGIDVFFVWVDQERQHHLHIATDPIPAGKSRKYFGPGIYLFKVVSHSDTGRSDHFLMKVDFSGGYGSLRVDNYKDKF